MKAISIGKFCGTRYEGTIWELAGVAQGLKVGEEMTFAVGTSEEVDRYTGWCGIKKVNLFDNDNDSYLIGYYGGEGNARLYQMSEYDPSVGSKFDDIFCTKNEHLFGTDELRERAIVAHMIVKFLEEFNSLAPELAAGTEIVTWEGADDGNYVVEATADYTGGGIYVFMGRLENGTYFLFDSEWMEAAFVDANPYKEEDAFTAEWQEEHYVENPFKTEEENKFFCNSVIDWILEYGTNGNYSKAEIAERKLR